MSRYAPLLSLALLAASCHPSMPEAPLRAADDPDFAPPQAVAVEGMADEPPAPFALAPGDILSLRMHSIERAEAQLFVDAQGSVSVPGVGAVAVVGLDVAAAERRVVDAMRQQDRYAIASLALVEAAGHQASVVGAVENPGQFALKPSTRLADLVAMSHGTKSQVIDAEVESMADLDGARVVRSGKALPVSVSKAVEGDPAHNVRVQPGDLVYVPPARGQRISVLGQVQRPKVIAFRRGVRMTEALAMAGGSTELADNADVRVIRGPLSKPRVYTASLRALVNGEAHDVLLEPGDVVFVTEHWFASVTQVVQRLTPFLAAGALTVAIAK